MSSTFSPMTGMREKPLRRPVPEPAARTSSRSIHTISVRGTITSRTMVSPSSKTRVDHLALGVLDDAPLPGDVDELAQLDLGGERTLAEATARGDRVADQDQQGRKRGEHPAEPRERPRPRSARRGTGAGDRGCGAHADERRRRPRPSRATVSTLDRPARCRTRHAPRRHQHRGGELGGDPQQEQQVRVAGAVTGDPVQRAARRGAPRASARRPGDRHPCHRGVRCGQQAGDRHQGDRHDERHDVATTASSTGRDPRPGRASPGAPAPPAVLPRRRRHRDVDRLAALAAARRRAARSAARTSPSRRRARRGRSRAGAAPRACSRCSSSSRE